MNRQALLDAVRARTARQRHRFYCAGARDSLVVWQQYFAAHRPITYYDGIVGGHHEVDGDLLERALVECERNVHGEVVDATATIHAFYEPTVALQDNDLEFPDAVEYAYYAIYNLHRLVFEVGPTTIDEQLVLNQLLSALLPAPIDRGLVRWWKLSWDNW